ncbi:MAG TPA: radical SAM family heme chaperone HemW [Steroidobacteraceae bacterium]|nr:radical SAM family heme chaperone HemW [Steroidobacteraceae bacterium]
MTFALPPLSLYVHMPWCVRKCPYCDFNSHRAPDVVPQREYISALLEDLELDLPSIVGRQVVSVFFGGGTPSLFSPAEIGAFLHGARQRIEFAAGAEITLEANPGTIERGRFAGYRDAGVNRVSLGVQSFNDEHLRALGRIHSAGDADRALDELREAGLDNFNLDLMYGLPNQSREQAASDVERAIASGPAHISHYQLTLEPGTAFHRRPPALPDPDLIWEIQLASQQRLAEAGYRHYEVSAYARPGRECAHNLNYWEYGDYLGLGAGAHGKITLGGMDIVRTMRIRSPHRYLSSTADERVEARTPVRIEERAFEFMLNALRLTSGTSQALFEARTGQTPASIASQIDRAKREGLVECRDGRWIPTEFGRRFLNELQARFLPLSEGPKAARHSSAADVTERASS